MTAERALSIARVPAMETHRLRAEVLHGGASLEAARVPSEDHPDVTTYAACDALGAVVSCVGLFSEPCPDLPGHPGDGWRLRRLATAEEWRGRGVGTQVVEAALAHVAGLGGGVVWCNATPGGAALFARLGFATIGEPWQDPEFGSNVRMWCEV